ncbi:MAG TPA: hypothetical protein VHC49_12540, partial [Mycobacteriales bacterium]|nr:hypothetical protein [Mycobacteriales bacterium]
RNAEDMDTVAALSCRHWSPAEIQQLKQQIKAAPPTHGTPVGALHVEKNTATQQVRITEPAGKSELATVRLTRRGDSWCAADPDAPAAPSSPPSSSSPPSATAPSSAEPTIPSPAVYDALAARFLDQVNAAHTATAESLLCGHPASDVRAHIEGVIAQHVTARIDNGHPPTGTGPGRIYTLHAGSGGGLGALATLAEDGHVCVYAFDLDTH